MAVTVLACFHSAQQPGVTRTPEAHSTPMPAMRGFIRFSPDTIGFYVDWRTQEVGIAAVRSGDEALMAEYRSGDVYHALALPVGLPTIPTRSIGRPQARPTPAHEAAAARDQLRHGRADAWPRA